MAEETRRMVPILGKNKEEVARLFVADGVARNKEQFEVAHAQWDKDKTVPEGFTVLPPPWSGDTGGVMSGLRSIYETVNTPLQTALSQGGKAVGSFMAAPPGLAQVLGPSAQQSLSQAGGTAGQAVGEELGAQVNTPRKAAMTATMAALPAVLGPVSIAAKGGGYALSKAGVLGNMGKAAVAGGTIPSLVDMATGGNPERPIAQGVGDAFVAALTNGVQGVLGHFITKYINPDIQEEAARNIIKPIADKYKNYGSDPSLFDAAMSSPKQIEEMASQLSKSLMGSAEKVALDYKNQLANVLPRAMSVGDQATLRAHMRRITEKAQNGLDNLDDGQAVDIAQKAMDQSIRAMGKFITDRMQAQGIKNLSNTDAAVAKIMQGFRSEVIHLNEGAHVLSAMQRSAQQNGFDPMAFREALMDMNYRSGGPQSLLAKVGDELGMGASLNKTADVPSATGMLDKVVGSALRHLPPSLRSFLAPEKVQPQQLMPWMMQGQGVGGTAIPLSIGVQSSGQEAVDNFMGGKGFRLNANTKK